LSSAAIPFVAAQCQVGCVCATDRIARVLAASMGSVTTQDARREGAAFVRALTVGVFVGALVGALIGGVGGRVAMRVLAVTSDDDFRGALTDDEEVVGEITMGGTVGLIIFIAILGVALDLLYLVLRRWLPARRPLRALSLAGLLWAVQGADMFDPDGFDFTELEPRWLSVAMFSAILLAAGAVTVLATDSALERWPEPRLRNLYAYLPLLGVLALFPLLVPVVVVGAAAWVGRRYPRIAALWRSRPVTVLGVSVLTALGVWFGVLAVTRVAEIVA
jgi:hypothetical protein